MTDRNVNIIPIAMAHNFRLQLFYSSRYVFQNYLYVYSRASWKWDKQETATCLGPYGSLIPIQYFADY
jgi:hypothetical protein